MSDEFGGLSLFGGDPDSRFLDLYNRFSNQYDAPGSFLQPDDPDLKAYQELSTQPTGAEDLIRNYMESMPTHEDYQPSTGRKMAAIFMGALSGNPLAAYRTAHDYVDDPYNEALQEWKNEGSKITSQANLINADRSRQLQSMKYGLQTKDRTMRAQAAQGMRANAESRRLAAEVADEEKAEQARQDRLEQNKFNNEMRTNMFNLSKQIHDDLEFQRLIDNTRRDEERAGKMEAAAEKDQDLAAINKRLNAVASQAGIDVTTLPNQSARAVAGLLAARRTRDKFKFFADRIDENGAINKDVNPKLAALLEKYLKQQQEKYLRGEF